jgi:hypothetical protein
MPGKPCLSPAGNDSCEIFKYFIYGSMSPIATDRSVRTRNERCLQLDTNAFLAASDNRF